MRTEGKVAELLMADKQRRSTCNCSDKIASELNNANNSVNKSDTKLTGNLRKSKFSCLIPNS